MGRGNAYTGAQLLVIQTERKEGHGAREILSKRPNLWFTRKGSLGALDKLTMYPDAARTRKAGSGRKPTKRTQSNIAKVKNLFTKSAGRTSTKKKMGASKLKRTAVQRIVKKYLNQKPLKTILRPTHEQKIRGSATGRMYPLERNDEIR